MKCRISSSKLTPREGGKFIDVVSIKKAIEIVKILNFFDIENNYSWCTLKEIKNVK